jgi:hypothetical protein
MEWGMDQAADWSSRSLAVCDNLVFIRIAGSEELKLEGSAWKSFPQKFDRHFCTGRSPYLKIFENASNM